MSAADGSWGTWQSFGGAAGAAPTVARDARGVMEVHALARAGAGVNLLPQMAPSSGWGSWTSASVPNGWADAACTLVANQDGRLESFVLTPAGSILSHRWQHTTTADAWSDWEEFGSGPCQYSATPGAVLDAAGRIHVFAVYADGSIWTCVQTGANSGWGTWLITTVVPIGITSRAPAGRAVVPTPKPACRDTRGTWTMLPVKIPPKRLRPPVSSNRHLGIVSRRRTGGIVGQACQERQRRA